MDWEAIEAVRRRPGMYIGSPREHGLRSLLYEIVGNALDEHLAGRATRIDVVLQDGDGAIVEDDGGGIPWHDVDGVPFVQRAMTSHHDTPTLDGHRPHVHVGLRGTGIFVVNALSARVEVSSWRGGLHFSQRYEDGAPCAPVIVPCDEGRHGTRIQYAPDPARFVGAELRFEDVRERFEELSLVHPRLAIDLLGERRRRATFAPHPGLVTAVGGGPDAIALKGLHEDVQVDVALRWRLEEEGDAHIRAFANGDLMQMGGTHQHGLLLGLANAVLPHLASHRRHSRTARRALTRGLYACVHVVLRDPQFETPTRAILDSPEAARAVVHVVKAQLPGLLAERPALRAALVERVDQALARTTR